MTAPFVGIDVSKARLDCQANPGPAWQGPSAPDGIAARAGRRRGRAPARVVRGAPGGLEAPGAAALLAAGVPGAVVTPRQVRDFAKAAGQLAKTDRLDAGILA